MEKFRKDPLTKSSISFLTKSVISWKSHWDSTLPPVSPSSRPWSTPYSMMYVKNFRLMPASLGNLLSPISRICRRRRSRKGFYLSMSIIRSWIGRWESEWEEREGGEVVDCGWMLFDKYLIGIFYVYNVNKFWKFDVRNNEEEYFREFKSIKKCF